MAPHAPRPFEFRLGRAGSGKTLSCLEDVAGHLALDPVGPPLLLLVPEQASAQMERRLVEMPGVGGYARARVVTFRWLRREAFEWGGGRPPELIDEIGRTLLLRRVMRRREGELRALGGAARLPMPSSTPCPSLIRKGELRRNRRTSRGTDRPRRT